MAVNPQSLHSLQQQRPHSFSRNGPLSKNRMPQRTLQASPRLKLFVTRLPPGTSTLDIYKNFCGYGSVVRIELFETREGFRSTNAEVYFQPVPDKEFWHRQLRFYTGSDESVEVKCERKHIPQQHDLKESPVRKGVTYEERTELHGKSLEFGVLTDPTKMMVMGRSGSMQNQTKLVLNLYRKEIEIHFPWQQISANRTAMRTFRFMIALDDEFKIWQLPDRSFVLHLTKPPWYSKQLAEAIANTHSPDAQRWTIEDTWARQTDLWTYKQRIPEINSSPITLPKHLNDINIFRWTTFRFDPVSDNANTSVARRFVDALKDWNVKVLNGDSFNTFVAQPNLDRITWKLINSTHLDAAVSTEASDLPIELPFSVRYQLEVCLSHGWLSEYSITPEFLKQLSEWPETRATQALLYVALDQKRLFDPMVIFKNIHYSRPARAKRLPNNCIEICSATVTSTGILFHTPAVEITNRIIRNHKSHAHRFLRVRFEDDVYRGQTRLYPATNNKMVMIFSRVKRTLVNGIKLGNITYDFLAWGNSQMREHGVYFFAPTDELTADIIRAEMGDFKETVVAKKAARMGQCFSTTRPVRMSLKMVHEPDAIPDIVRNGYTFTDGVGKISPGAAELVASQLQIKGPTPCLFQFRLGGCKGVLAVSNDVPGVDVRIRKSQLKFSSLSNELEINRYAQFWQSSLNRQIILCLSSLGVPTEVFLRKQDQTIDALDRAMDDDSAAINALRSNVDPNMMTLSLSQMVEAGFRESQEPFVVSLLELWRAWSLKYLKEKAKIPIEHGAFILGTVDETATLHGHTSSCPSGDRDVITKDPAYLEKLPEIFLQITDHKTGQQRIIEGICILARNPSLHRGDIRVVRARNVPALHHMCDVVVMPQLGERDLSSMCSGGDLDGDDYIVIWDQDLIPQFWNAEPFHYTPPVPKTAAGEIKTSDLIDFFHDYMQNDALGKIANAHLAAADFLDDGLESAVCLELVQLHSMAVDYPKSGVAAKMERRLERAQRPHFMESKFGKPYHSHKVLGQLYDRIDKYCKKTEKDASVKHKLEFDSRILEAFDPDEELLNEVEAVKSNYDISLRRILTQHSIRTEFELWSTFVLHHSKKSRDFKFHEEVGELSRALKEEYFEELCDLAGGRDFDHLAPVAVAAYRLARDQLQAAKSQTELQQEDGTATEMPFISFPWLLQDTLIKICAMTGNNNEQKTEGNDLSCENKAEAILEDIEDKTVDGLHDIFNFRLTRDKLSPYLPDPLTSNIVVTIQDGTEEEIAEARVEPEPTAMSEARSPEKQSTVREIDEAQPHTPESAIDHADENSGLDEIQLVVSNQTSGATETPVDLNNEVQHYPTESDSAAAKQTLERGTSNSGACQQTQTPVPGVLVSPKLQHRPPTGRRSRRQATCFYWKTNGSCKYSEHECKYAHHDTGVNMLEKQQVTCYFWFNGDICTFDEETCKFAHYDTGYYAPQPLGSLSTATKRIVVDDSEGDDIEYFPAPKSTPRSPRKAMTSHWIDEYAARQGRVNRRNGQQPHVYTDLKFGPKSIPETVNDNVFATAKRIAEKLSAEEYAAGGVRTGFNGADSSHQGGPTQTSLPRVPISPGTKDFTPKSIGFNGGHTLQQQSHTQIQRSSIDLTARTIPPTGPSRSYRCSPSKSRQRDVKSTSSWTDDLKDLIFDDLIIKPQKSSASGSERDFTVITSNTPGTKSSAPLDNDLIDMNQEDPQHHTIPIRHTTAVVQSLTINRPSSTTSFDLLLDDYEVIMSNKDGKTSGSQSFLPSDLVTTPNDHDNTVDLALAESPVSLKRVNTFNDPLTCGGNGDEEPEIEELFD